MLTFQMTGDFSQPVLHNRWKGLVTTARKTRAGSPKLSCWKNSPEHSQKYYCCNACTYYPPAGRRQQPVAAAELEAPAAAAAASVAAAAAAGRTDPRRPGKRGPAAAAAAARLAGRAVAVVPGSGAAPAAGTAGTPDGCGASTCVEQHKVRAADGRRVKNKAKREMAKTSQRKRSTKVCPNEDLKKNLTNISLHFEVQRAGGLSWTKSNVGIHRLEGCMSSN